MTKYLSQHQIVGQPKGNLYGIFADGRGHVTMGKFSGEWYAVRYVPRQDGRSSDRVIAGRAYTALRAYRLLRR